MHKSSQILHSGLLNKTQLKSHVISFFCCCELIMIQMIATSGTESCVGTCGSSSLTNPNCESFNLPLLFLNGNICLRSFYSFLLCFVSCSLQQTRDLVPFFLCMDGDFRSAVVNMLSAVNAPAARLTPHLFLFYLCVLRKATAPSLVVTQPAQLCYANVQWCAIKGLTERAEFSCFKKKNRA